MTDGFMVWPRVGYVTKDSDTAGMQSKFTEFQLCIVPLSLELASIKKRTTSFESIQWHLLWACTLPTNKQNWKMQHIGKNLVTVHLYPNSGVNASPSYPPVATEDW